MLEKRPVRLAARIFGLAGFFLKAGVLGQRMPLIASFKLTYRCNLSCRACPFHARARLGGSHMSRAVAIRALHALKAMGLKILVFEGGEPLLWKDGDTTFHDLALYARRLFACTCATTNGTLPLDVPVDVLWVSIDGMKHTHDRLRSNSFDRAMENIRASRHGKLFVHYTLHSGNLRDFEETVLTISSMERIRGITVQLFYPYGRGEEDLRLTMKDREEAVRLAVDLKLKGYPVMNSVEGLKGMVRNTWRCRDRLLANVEPDGSLSVGCYVKNRGVIDCGECGFTPVAEASAALDLKPGSLLCGWRLFVT